MLDHGVKDTHGQIQHLDPSEDTDELGVFLPVTPNSTKEHLCEGERGWKKTVYIHACVCFYLL